MTTYIMDKELAAKEVFDGERVRKNAVAWFKPVSSPVVCRVSNHILVDGFGINVCVQLRR